MKKYREQIIFGVLIMMTAFVFGLALSGCGSGACIKIGGGYKDYAGEVEYCFDKAKSEEIGVPILEEKTSEGSKEIFGFDLDQVKAIWDKLKGLKTETPTASTRSTPAPVSDKHPAKEILEFIRLRPGYRIFSGR